MASGSCLFDNFEIQAVKKLRGFGSEHCAAFERSWAHLKNAITLLNVFGGDMRAPLDYSEHVANHHGDGHRLGDLGVAAYQGGSDAVEGVLHAGEDLANDAGIGSRRNENRGKKPSGTGTGYGDVVGVDNHREFPDVSGGQCHRVRRCDERAAGNIDDGSVLADLRPEADFERTGDKIPKQLNDLVLGQLAGKEYVTRHVAPPTRPKRERGCVPLPHRRRHRELSELESPALACNRHCHGHEPPPKDHLRLQ